MQAETTAIRKDNVAVAAARVAAGQDTSPLLGVKIHKDRWRAQVYHESTSIHLGCFDHEEEAGRAVDWALANLLDRPGDANYDDTGGLTGNDPRRHHTAVRTVNLVGNAKQESKHFGVSKNGTKWRATLRVPFCKLDNKGKEFHHSLPLPVCPTVAAGGVCACKTRQIMYPNSADETAAAKFYDSRVRHYGLDEPPHNKPTNFAIE